MTFPRISALATLWCILVGTAVARSSTIILTPVADTALLGVASNNNAGVNINFVAGRGTNGSSHALLKFNPAPQIPANSVITSVTLQLTVTVAASTNDVGFNLNRMRVDWNEGTGNFNGGTPALPGESTWSHRFFNTTPWSAPGADPTNDFEAAPSGSARVQGPGTYSFASTLGLVADVQAWLDQPSTNFGWILRGADETDISSNRRFASREDLMDRQPKLTVQFTAPPVTAVLAPVADTGLLEDIFQIGWADNNMGGEKFFPVGTTFSSGGFGRNRGLIRFDLAASLPSNAVIQSATLNLRVSRDNRGAVSASPFQLHRVLRAWGEGTNTGMRGTPALMNDATWNSRQHSVALWGAPGGEPDTDFVSAPSATTTLGYTNAAGYNFSSPQLLGDVQAWLNLPGTNFGWMVLNAFENATGTARRIGSREGVTNAPRLTLVYVTLDATDPPMLAMLDASNDLFQFSFIGEAGRSYSVQKRDSLTAGDWATFSNLGPLGIATNLVVTDAMTPSNAFYRVIKN